jgi:hypothetical protein
MVIIDDLAKLPRKGFSLFVGKVQDPYPRYGVSIRYLEALNAIPPDFVTIVRRLLIVDRSIPPTRCGSSLDGDNGVRA